MPDDDETEGREGGSPGDWRAFEERYNAEPEPEEFDPQELGPDIPEAPDLTEVEASSEVRYRFWALVMVFNTALLATSLGVLFVVFQGELELGGQLTLAGLLLFAFGYYRYRQTKAALAEDDDDVDDEDNDDDVDDEDNDDDMDAQEDVDDRSDESDDNTANSGSESDKGPDRNG